MTHADSMTVSVVIPAYNAEHTVARAVASVLAQTRPADEIIVVDDGSSDRTAEVVQSFGDQVRLICRQNGGASEARNTGVLQASSQWIAFLDADDEWLQTCLQKHAALISRNPTLSWTAGNFWLCYCREDRRVEKISVERGIRLLSEKEYFDDYFQAFIQGAAGWTGTKCIRKEAIIDAGLFKPGQPMGNDIDMWWRIAYRYSAIGYIPEPIAVYHMNIENSITRTQRSPQLLVDLLKRHLDLAQAGGSLDRFKPCAEHMLRFWLDKYLRDDRITAIPAIMQQLPGLISPGQKRRLKVLTRFPRLTRYCLPVLKKIKTVKKNIACRWQPKTSGLSADK